MRIDLNRRTWVRGRRTRPRLAGAAYACRLKDVSGISLLELIGSLAVIACLAALGAENLVQRHLEKRRRTEAATMTRIAEAFERAVLLQKTLPSTNPASWAVMVASQLGLPVAMVRSNTAGSPRLIVYDPALNVGGRTPATLPFVQQAQGATNVVSPRLVLVSSLAPGYPNLDLTTPSAFSNLWHRADHELPKGWPAGAAADPDDIVIQRLDLSPRFHEVLLNNLDGYAVAPFAILTNALLGVGYSNVVAATNVPLATRYLHGTPLRLYYGNGQPQVVALITDPVSYTFEKGRWNRGAHLGINGPATCGTLGTLVELFTNRQDWSPTSLGTSPESVILGMYDMLLGCTDWSEAGFEMESGNSKWEPPTARFVYDAAPQLMLSLQDLIGL